MAVTWKKLAYEDDVITKAFMATKGDILYASAGGTPAVLAIGADNHILRVATDIPAWEAIGAPDTHHDTHDPEDGADALDCAAPSELASVQATGEGSAHEFARADHQHQIQHSIADNHLVTMDDAGPAVDDEYARFTADGLEGRAVGDVRTDLNVADGADVTGDNAPKAHKASHENGGADELTLDALGEPVAAVKFDGQQATDLVLENSAEPPATAVIGKIYFDTDLSAYICTVAA